MCVPLTPLLGRNPANCLVVLRAAQHRFSVIKTKTQFRNVHNNGFRGASGCWFDPIHALPLSRMCTKLIRPELWCVCKEDLKHNSYKMYVSFYTHIHRVLCFTANASHSAGRESKSVPTSHQCPKKRCCGKRLNGHRNGSDCVRNLYKKIMRWTGMCIQNECSAFCTGGVEFPAVHIDRNRSSI